MPFPTADALTVNTNWNVTVTYCIFMGLTQDFELKILMLTYIPG